MRKNLIIPQLGHQNLFLFLDCWPNPGPGRLPLDSGRGDVEFAGVFASVAFLTVNFVPNSIFWNPAEKK